MAYSDKVLDHYENPRNVGAFEKDDDSVGTGMVGAPACGDVMKLQIKVGADGLIEDAKFKTYGCGSAIASSSLVTEWVKGNAGPGAGHQEHPDRRRTGAAAGEDPLFYLGGRRHQGGRAGLQNQARGRSLSIYLRRSAVSFYAGSVRMRGTGTERMHGNHTDRKSSETHQPLHRTARQRRRPALRRAHDGLLGTGLQAGICR